MTPQIPFEVSLLLKIDSKCLIELTLLQLSKWIQKSINNMSYNSAMCIKKKKIASKDLHNSFKNSPKSYPRTH